MNLVNDLVVRSLKELKKPQKYARSHQIRHGDMLMNPSFWTLLPVPEAVHTYRIDKLWGSLNAPLIAARMDSKLP